MGYEKWFHVNVNVIVLLDNLHTLNLRIHYWKRLRGNIRLVVMYMLKLGKLQRSKSILSIFWMWTWTQLSGIRDEVTFLRMRGPNISKCLHAIFCLQNGWCPSIHLTLSGPKSDGAQAFPALKVNMLWVACVTPLILVLPALGVHF